MIRMMMVVISQASLSESVTSNQFTNSIPIYSLYMLASPAKQAWVQQMVNEAELGDAACPPGPQMDCKKYLKKYL